ncbi:unnamed protein product [Spirodela intermedia]|uniref:Pectinesterase inhibitor domain-containing protein n=1 Tax=Spirodela intermedia TaxID=51605 RepID=A0A7I8J1N7_SPIIN|nr:unnamed protein product [Spirodela intermedia]CAA6663311.1 unnamed protein product [Spirodela intermedia]
MELVHIPMILSLAAAVSVCDGAAGAATGIPGGGDVGFIRASCSFTLYPRVCERCLARYASAVKGSHCHLAGAASTRPSELPGQRQPWWAATLSGPPPPEPSAVGGGAPADGPAGTPNYAWRLSNLQTWVSAALTNEITCLDGVTRARVDPVVKATICGRIIGLKQMTSNALAFINHLAAGP